MEPNTNSAPSGVPVAPPIPAQPAENPVPDIPTSPSIPEEKPTKSSKALIWCLSIIAIMGVTAAAIFAYLYFTTPTTPSNSSDSGSSQFSTPTDTEDSTPSDSDTTEETEITDTYILRDLNEKMATLHHTDETGPLLMTGGIVYNSSLYEKGTLNEKQKLIYVIDSIKPNYYIDYNERQELITKHSIDDTTARLITEKLQIGYKGETVATKYYDIFGEELVKGALDGQTSCPDLYYYPTNDFYYDIATGCGGTGPLFGAYYKNKYTTDDEHAYVYVSAGTFNKEDNKIYCDVIGTTFETNPPTICGEAEKYEDFIIDETNYQNFAKYRFVFNKADDGTHYFSKVEKL